MIIKTASGNVKLADKISFGLFREMQQHLLTGAKMTIAQGKAVQIPEIEMDKIYLYQDIAVDGMVKEIEVVNTGEGVVAGSTDIIRENCLQYIKDNFSLEDGTKVFNAVMDIVNSYNSTDIKKN